MWLSIACPSSCVSCRSCSGGCWCLFLPHLCRLRVPDHVPPVLSGRCLGFCCAHPLHPLLLLQVPQLRPSLPPMPRSTPVCPTSLTSCHLAFTRCWACQQGMLWRRWQPLLHAQLTMVGGLWLNHIQRMVPLGSHLLAATSASQMRAQLRLLVS
jgi:hypothetical protein